MNMKLKILFLVGVLFIGMLGMGSAVTNLVVCDNLNSDGEYYVLLGDVSESNDCFNISASNIVLDGAGYSISTSGSRAIYSTNVNNITIKNVTLTGNSLGIDFNGVNDSLIKNVSVKSNSNGVKIYGSFNLSIENASIVSNVVDGLIIFGSNQTNLNNLNLSSNRVGLNLSLSSNTVANNLFADYVGVGIYFENSSDNHFSGLDINHDNVGNSLSGVFYGIFLLDSQNNFLKNITITDISQSSAYIKSSDNVEISNFSTVGPCDLFYTQSSNNQSYNNFNMVSSTGSCDALFLVSVSNSTFRDIQASNVSEGDGVYLSSASENNLFVNVTSYNNFWGIQVLVTAQNNTIINSSLNDNNISLYLKGLGINETHIIDTYIDTYNFSQANGIDFLVTGKGKISFLNPIIANGSNLSRDVFIDTNFVSVNSSVLGLNSSANITLYGLSTSTNKPSILRDGVACSGLVCNNFTSLNAGTVIFNVASWTNYSVGPDPAFWQGTCGQTITTDTTLTQDITGCTGNGIVIGANGILLDFNGYNLTGDNGTTDYGVFIVGYNETTIVNGRVYNFGRGIFFNGSETNVLNNSISSNNYGISFFTSLYNFINHALESLTLTLEGNDTTEVIVTMNDSSKIYVVEFDSVACPSANCVINSQSNGVLNLSLTLD